MANPSGVFQPGLLAGKTAFLTGASSGIGLRMAERFAQSGARVILNGRNPQKLAAAADAIRAAGGAAETHAADVRDYAALEAGFQHAHSEWGPLDILVCGAAGNFPAPVAGLSPNGFKAVIDIDVLGTFHACRAAYAYLRKPGASVLAISAAHGFQAIPFQAHVCAAKAGVDQLIRVLAMEWGREGIRANIITPGPTAETEGMSRLAPTGEIRRALERRIPLGRFGTKDELADLALFLVSEAAPYITGATFVCDGGTSLAAPGLGLDGLLRDNG